MRFNKLAFATANTLDVLLLTTMLSTNVSVAQQQSRVRAPLTRVTAATRNPAAEDTPGLVRTFGSVSGPQFKQWLSKIKPADAVEQERLFV